MEARAFAGLPEGQRVLANQLMALKNEGIEVNGIRQKYTFAEVAMQTGISRTAISLLCNRGSRLREAQAQSVIDWMAKLYAKAGSTGNAQAQPLHYKTKLEIYATQDYLEALGMLDWVQKNRKMCVMIGHPGVGKTTVLREYQKTAEGVHYIVCRPTMHIRDLLNVIADTMGLTLTGSNDERVRRIQRELMRRPDIMLVFDEADHLCTWDVKKFEIIRQIWDETGTPIILAGPPRLEDILTRGSGRQNLSQLYRRKFEIKLQGATAEEVRRILGQYRIEPEAATELVKIATDKYRGGMGTFVEIFGLCLEAAGGGVIDSAILAGARRNKLASQ